MLTSTCLVNSLFNRGDEQPPSGTSQSIVSNYTYYYAGTQRIAMRTNGTLNFLLGDHLGSTSLVTDAVGNIVFETRYKAWGETRYTSGNEVTKYQYTGQYSYAADFGLHFYNARWYDSSLSRFAQADTIVPGGLQGMDRYAYTNNNPVRYVDPSGHCSLNGHWMPDTDPACGWASNNQGSLSGNGNGGFVGSSSGNSNPLSGCSIHCTKEDMKGATLEQRMDWFNGLLENMNENYGAGTSEWFNNIKTVLGGFIASGQDDNQWVLDVDAVILLSVQDGYVASLYSENNPFLPSSPQGLWFNFFNNLASGQTSTDELIAKWGDAEQAATNAGMAGTNAKMGPDDWLFVQFGNGYRTASHGPLCQNYSCSTDWLGFFNPQTTMMFGISPVILPMIPFYYLDTVGVMATGH